MHWIFRPQLSCLARMQSGSTLVMEIFQKKLRWTLLFLDMFMIWKWSPPLSRFPYQSYNWQMNKYHLQHKKWMNISPFRHRTYPILVPQSLLSFLSLGCHIFPWFNLLECQVRNFPWLAGSDKLLRDQEGWSKTH